MKVEDVVGVVGLGYVGLPLAIACVEAGYKTVGFDTSVEVVQSINSGISLVSDVPSGVVSQAVKADLRASADAECLRDCSTIVICVPTPLLPDGKPNMAPLEDAVSKVSHALEQTDAIKLVIIESTTYPGTTEELVAPLLNRSGKYAGVDFALAFSPERIDPGNTEFKLRNTPKLVGGYTPDCGRTARDFYLSVVDEVVLLSGTREAEMAKLLENTYRHVNIALVNELVRFCQALKIDFWEVLRGAESKPFGFQRFDPGPGVGGHCIPIDPLYLSHKISTVVGQPFRFVELANDINATMPAYIVGRLQEMLNGVGLPLQGAKVLVAGLTYKSNISDARETPARPIIQMLSAAGAQVSVFDPHLANIEIDGFAYSSIANFATSSDEYDAILLLQAHSEFLPTLARANCKVLFDTRGCAELPSPPWQRL